MLFLSEVDVAAMSIRNGCNDSSYLGIIAESLKPKLKIWGIFLTVVIVVGYILLKNIWLIPVLAMLSGIVKPFLSSSSDSI